MSRIKEELELMTAEINTFQSNVKVLGSINENLKEVKVSVDLQELKSELHNFHNQMESYHLKQKQLYSKMESLHKKSEIRLKRLIVIGGSVIFITAVLFLYLYRTFSF